MPICELVSNVNLSDDDVQNTLIQLENVIANVLSKPVGYVTINFDFQKNLRFGGSNEGSCLVKITSIGGINRSNNSLLADKITNIVANALKVKPRRVYVEFRDLSAQNLACNGSLFG